MPLSPGVIKILEQTEKRASERPDWHRSDYARRELERLREKIDGAEDDRQGPLPL
jgi:hypothetical protein